MMDKVSCLIYTYCFDDQVPVIDGEAEISIKEGTQSGAVLRLRSRGVPKLMSGDASQRGDHYFTVGVEIPTNLSDSEKEIIQVTACIRKYHPSLPLNLLSNVWFYFSPSTHITLDGSYFCRNYGRKEETLKAKQEVSSLG